ncbi:unnamed protein product, partial [Polarella glacialis]
VTIDLAQTQCIAFFKRGNGVTVESARMFGLVVLGGGVLVSIVNAIIKRDISDDGIAVFSCGEEPKKPGQSGPTEEVNETDRDIAALEQHVGALKEGVSTLERLFVNMPNIEPPTGPPAEDAAPAVA